MRNFPLTLSAGQTLPINYAGDFIKIQSANDDVEIELRSNHADNVKTVAGKLRAGQWFKATNVFEVAYITSDTAQNVEVIVAYGLMGDNSVAGTVSISPQTDAAGLARLTLTGAQTIAGNVARQELVLRADENNAGNIWIGSTVANSGVALVPGASLTLGVTGDVPVFGSGSDKLEILEIV